MSGKYEPTSAVSTITASSQAIGTLAAGEDYVLSVSVDCWFRTDGQDAVVGTAGSHFLAKGATDIQGGGAALEIIKDTGQEDGRASLSRGRL